MTNAMTLQNIMNSRRSIRHYDPHKMVEKEKLNLLLEAAMSAPSACNLQPWEFIVMQQPESVSKLKTHIYEDNGRHYNAPCAIVICANTSYLPWEGRGEADCHAAIQNILLMATALSLGTVWIGAFDESGIKQSFEIPSHVVVNAIILLGYPNEQKPMRTQFKEEAVYHENYEPLRPHAARSIDWRFL